MSLFLRISFGILIIFFVTDCASYWQNRRKDLQDVVHVGAETPVYGAGFRLFFLPVGFYFAGGESELGKRDKGAGFGLRGGDFGKYHSQQLVFGILGGENFHSGEALRDENGKVIFNKQGIQETDDERANLKSVKMRYFSFFNDPVDERNKRKKEEFRRRYMEDMIRKTKNKELQAYIPEREPKPFGYPPGFNWQIDVFFGLYGGVRAGINLAELADFVVGFTTIDMLGDDVE
ncbi:MAG: hypothetical protein JJT78_06680 [Leptospira sp.]|nr:hypothetical protein [Leptospira sp.]